MTTTWSGCSPGLYSMALLATMSSTTLLLLISLDRNVSATHSEGRLGECRAIQSGAKVQQHVEHAYTVCQ